jgi:acyl dehydratase
MTSSRTTPAQLGALLGQEIGASSWITIDQQRIVEFAHCTGDHQWIHVDVERARRESPFGGTVAHGFLTLSLLASTGFEVLLQRVEVKQAVNFGLEKVRFLAPVRAPFAQPRRARAARATSAATSWPRCSPGCGRTTSSGTTG